MADTSNDEDRSADPHAGPGDPRVDAGLEHLQAAAMELIGAARSFLDVIEDVVRDRDKMADAMTAVGSVVEAAARGARRAGVDLGAERRPDRDRVQTIPVQ